MTIVTSGVVIGDYLTEDFSFDDAANKIRLSGAGLTRAVSAASAAELSAIGAAIGTAGPQGPTGPQGPQGPVGPSLSVATVAEIQAGDAAALMSVPQFSAAALAGLSYPIYVNHDGSHPLSAISGVINGNSNDHGGYFSARTNAGNNSASLYAEHLTANGNAAAAVVRNAAGSGSALYVAAPQASTGAAVVVDDAAAADHDSLHINRAAGAGVGWSITVNHQSTGDGGGIYVNQSSPALSSGVAGAFQLTGGSNAAALWASNESSSGDGAGGFFEHTGVGNGAAVSARIGYSGGGTGAAIDASTGPQGTRYAVVNADRAGSNTTHGVATNATVVAAGGFITSDKRLKTDFVDNDDPEFVKACVELSKRLRSYTFMKLVDATSIERMAKKHAAEVAERTARAEANVRKLRKQLQAAHEVRSAAIKANGDLTATLATVQRAEQEIKTLLGLIDKAAAAAAPEVPVNFDTSDDARKLGRQAGVIAQELQELTKELGWFEFLVTEIEPGGMLSVDYTSLNILLARGFQARLTAAGV